MRTPWARTGRTAMAVLVSLGACSGSPTTPSDQNAMSPGDRVPLEDDFNLENGGLGVTNYFSLAKWDIADGSVDLLGPGRLDFLPGNGLYVDLDGTSANAVRLVSKASLVFVSGDRVTVSFDLAGPCLRGLPECAGFDKLNKGTNSVRVTLGPHLDETFTKAFDEPFETITRSFTVTGASSERLVFDHTGGDSIGLILDNVRIRVGS